MRIFKNSSIDKKFNATRLSESEVEKIFSSLGIEYVKYISSGDYADVFETIFAGKRVVVKVTHQQRDYKNYRALDEIRQSMSAEDAKYLPVTYFFHSIDFQGKTYYLIGVEPLLPLDPSVKQNMFEYSKTHRNYFAYDPDKLAKSISRLTYPIIGRNPHVLEASAYYALNIKNNLKALIEIIANFFDKKTLIKTDLSKEANEELNRSLLSLLNSIFFREHNKHLVDRSVDKMTENEESIPETKNFVAFCKKLKKQYGIEAEDIHPGNLMMRNNGDIVISDVGNFINKRASREKLEDKYYQYADKSFQRASDLDNQGISAKDSRNRIAKEVFKKLNLPLVKELGSGVYTSSYESFFAGKRVCVKVTQSETDYKSYSRVKELQNSLKASDKKFLPKIYKLAKLDNYYLIICELLLPLEPNVEANLFSLVDSRFNKSKLTHKLCKGLVLDRIKYFSTSYPFRWYEDLFLNQLDNLSQFVLVLSKQTSFLTRSQTVTIFNKWLSVLLPEQKRNVIDYKESIYKFFDFIVGGCVETVDRQFSSVEEDAEFAEMAPEKEDFVKFLKRMDKEHNTMFGDLHHRNLMMRPNGDIVISDVGMVDNYDDIED